MKAGEVEAIKAASQGLRGPIAKEIGGRNSGGGLSEAAYTLLKFHGTYEQFDRDTATARKQAGQDKDWSFMVRVRAPAGRLSASQWLALDALAESHADATLRVTTRQGVQFHGVLRENLRGTIAGIHEALLTTLAACGDVVRNVITSPAPRRDAVHARLEAEAFRLSSALLPRSRAHHEIFLGEKHVAGEAEDALYGAAFLPRKFKIALIHPDDNSADVLANDLGFVLVPEGWIVMLGGGMGMTHNKPSTFPRLADPVALIGPDEVLEVAEAAVRLHRDFGRRDDRKQARLKYVLHEKGPAWARAQLSADLGRTLAPPPSLPRLRVPEHLGWHDQGDGRFWLGLSVPSGRVAGPWREALREVINLSGANPIGTPQQDLLLSDIAPEQRAAVEAVLARHGIPLPESLSPLRRATLACVALPTCGQALAEGERVREEVTSAIEAELDALGLLGERISLRITGCPNGCARPYQAEIGVVGRAPGLYTLFVGGAFEGTRLNEAIADKIPPDRIALTLRPVLEAWAAWRLPGEGFGDFCARLGRLPVQRLLKPAAA
ncbi:NADPH-dependent assimilatory sulfite reductase hemoprotein subunit [Sabulicella glaciei]|uniref:NADPH-dependent assimilatory sulfite reductase hemoprotein subunit n=1 Tax=Sabulicella glaciei TaxID=2984948 RepID=A0ABT3NPG6_9PROT|nr:NADPH-dependent assimilatory sulfite reductase hemoprotein subunit [Roseococcus sp. MDT2-1-1]MCW8084058.1 NADPH-dependent assimilatory sulfite reductase hemoprotein subunit [Roseococcus sp. MDT2-1-1]